MCVGRTGLLTHLRMARPLARGCCATRREWPAGPRQNAVPIASVGDRNSSLPRVCVGGASGNSALTPKTTWLAASFVRPDRAGCASPLFPSILRLREKSKFVRSKRFSYVGWSALGRKSSRLCSPALYTAFAERQPSATVIFSPNHAGSFRARRYQRILKTHGRIGLMGRIASSGDNVAMESDFALLQNDSLDRYAWQTRENLTVTIITST